MQHSPSTIAARIRKRVCFLANNGNLKGQSSFQSDTSTSNQLNSYAIAATSKDNKLGFELREEHCLNSAAKDEQRAVEKEIMLMQYSPSAIAALIEKTGLLFWQIKGILEQDCTVRIWLMSDIHRISRLLNEIFT